MDYSWRLSIWQISMSPMRLSTDVILSFKKSSELSENSIPEISWDVRNAVQFKMTGIPQSTSREQLLPPLALHIELVHRLVLLVFCRSRSDLSC